MLVALLGIVVLALGAYAWRSQQALHLAGERLAAERQQRSQLEQRLTELEKTLTTWSNSPAFKPAPLPPVGAALPSMAAAETGDSVVDAAAAERRFVADILTNPERREAYMAQHRMIARLQYADFIKRLDLNPADADSLIEILAQRQMATLGRNLGVKPADASTFGGDGPADLDTAEASDITALLGPDKAARFAEYRATLQERSMLTPLVQELDLARIALKPDQVDEMARILKQEQDAMRLASPVAAAPIEGESRESAARAQHSYAKALLDWQLELNQRIATRSAQVLSAEQQQRFVAGQQQQLELQRLSMALIEPDAPAN